MTTHDDAQPGDLSDAEAFHDTRRVDWEWAIYRQSDAEDAATCPVHDEPWLPGSFHGRRRCTFYVPELGVSEDYGCPQDSRLT